MHTHKHREKITWDISKIGRILDCKTWFSKLERIETIQRPAIPLLGIYIQRILYLQRSLLTYVHGYS